MSESIKDFAAQLQAIIETAIDGIIVINHKGIIEKMNPAAASLFQVIPKQIIGENILILMPEPYRGEHDGYMDRYQKTKIPHIIGIGREVQGLKSDGTIFPLRLAVSEVILHNRIIYTGIIHDLSEVKKAEEEILALNARLEETVRDRTNELEKTVNQLLATNHFLNEEITERKKVESDLQLSRSELQLALNKEKELNELKSRFVSMASHEFRTPLTTIASSASLIGKYPNADQQSNREKHLERIKSSVANLTGILNDFLSLSKLEEGKVILHLDAISFETLAHSILDETKQLLKSGQNINLLIENNQPTVITDQRLLKNILFNLASNAIKYSEKDIFWNIHFLDDKVHIQIKDHGIGIPEHDQKYLFTRFFRASNVVHIQGTGLGLNIVKRYVQLLSGDIQYESQLDKGSTFTLTIPYVHPQYQL